MFDPQWGASVLGVIAIGLVARKNRWGVIFGFASQPFWIWMSLQKDLSWILILSFVYWVNWGIGIWHWWIKPAIKFPARQPTDPPESPAP